MVNNELKKELFEIVSSYQIQINHMHTINQIAVKYLYDFPNKLPDEIQESIDVD